MTLSLIVCTSAGEAASNSRCKRRTIRKPALIEKVCGAVWTSGPCQRRDSVDDKANVLYISRFFEAMSQGCHAHFRVIPHATGNLCVSPCLRQMRTDYLQNLIRCERLTQTHSGHRHPLGRESSTRPPTGKLWRSF